MQTDDSKNMTISRNGQRRFKGRKLGIIKWDLQVLLIKMVNTSNYQIMTRVKWLKNNTIKKYQEILRSLMKRCKRKKRNRIYNQLLIWRVSFLLGEQG